MRKIREVLRLKFEHHFSVRRIAKSCHISRSTASDYLARFAITKLPWPLPTDMDESTLEQRLFPTLPVGVQRHLTMPDWSKIHIELRRPGVTLMLLWQEYKANYPEGFQYSWFSEQYREWRQCLDASMRQTHIAGEKLFIDYAGQTMPVLNQHTGEIKQAQIFVATLGASGYSYAEATWSQALPDWTASHVRTFNFLGGVPELLVPDNLKSAVSTAHRYEPEKNPTYQDLAEHYQVAVLPARVRKPKDKSKVESTVQVVERWILARLRDRTFFSLQALNEAMSQLLEELNSKPFQKLNGSRLSIFETIDKPALKPLPQTPYQFAEWKEVRVHIDYHVEVDKHYYSVPYQLIKKQLSVRITSQTIECFYRGNRVSSHHRSSQQGRHSTHKEHRPEKHRQHAEWTPERLRQWASETGPETEAVVMRLMSGRKHPEQVYRSCLGILRLGKAYGKDRLESACRRALYVDACSYRSISSMLKNCLDQQPLPEPESETQLPEDHENLRGSSYYH